MAMSMFIFILFFGSFMKNVMTYNPLLTYTLRYNKISLYPNITGNYTINEYKTLQYINGYVKIDTKEQINKAVVSFYRCNPEGINCEYFQSWEITDFCIKLKQKNQIWSSWYDAFDPPMECPIMTFFRVRNATIDVQPVLRWYPDATNYQWKVVQQLYAKNISLGSYTLYVSIFGYRKKNIKPLLKN